MSQQLTDDHNNKRKSNEICKCGGTDHQRTSFLYCPLNKRRRVDTLDSNPTTSARANHIAHNIQPNNNSNLSFQSQINHQQNTSYNIANQRQLNFSDHLPLTVSNYSHISTRIPQINLTNVNIIQSFYI